ncbi:MAG: 30S ribosomal protein S17 [Candidatus Paceibacterota bacterium]|jgi:small subunit ribosomal protein S17
MDNKKEIKKRRLTGEVVSDKMQKTRVVAIVTTKRHPVYEKLYKSTTKIKAHDENNQYKIGDVVIIQETRPLSKDKRWEIVELVKKAKVAEKIDAEVIE